MIVLASGSPRRKELLASLGVPFVVIKSDIDETQHDGEAPTAYAERLSREKAHAIAERIRAGEAPDEAIDAILAADTVVILAADTIGDLDGEILGKPEHAAEARMMLERLRDRPHVVCTALTLLPCQRDGEGQLITGDAMTEITLTRVFMRPYSDDEIDAYIATGDPFDKAGGYAIQHAEFAPVARIEGSHSNVIGLPMETLERLLNRLPRDK